MRTIEEVLEPGPIPRVVHPEWADALPWLAQGTTTALEERDFRLFGPRAAASALADWEALGAATACRALVHSRQVHGDHVLEHTVAAPGLRIAPDADGHVTDLRDLLLTVSVADCVPVSIVDTRRRTIALVHAGWRGVAAGIAERALSMLVAAYSADVNDIVAHAGPSICGRCYEVGPEVHEALGSPRPPLLRRWTSEPCWLPSSSAWGYEPKRSRRAPGARSVTPERSTRIGPAPRVARWATWGWSPGRSNGGLDCRYLTSPGVRTFDHVERGLQSDHAGGTVCRLPARAGRREPATDQILPVPPIAERLALSQVPRAPHARVHGLRARPL